MYPVATLLLKRSLFCALAACCSLSVRAQQIGPEAEQAVGYVLNADNGKLTRAGTLLPLQAKAGDFLFAGDALRSLTGSLSFLYCPERSSYELPAVGEVTFVQEHLDLQEGQLVNHTPQAICRLPRITRNQPGTQLHNAASLIKDVLPDQPLEGSLDSRLLDLPVDRRDALRQELGPIDGRLRENPGDIIARLARAALLDEYGLSADAANEYRKVLESAPDSTGARSRAMLHDENHQKKRLQAVRQQGVSNEERTYALLVGVSSYQDPRIRPLQYAHEDALLFERHLRSARGGQLGDQDLTVLLDEKATAARIRLALDTLLKAQADQNDTVLIFVASHGTVDPRTGQGFIVAYDSDPEDLAATALPMQDLQNLVNQELRDVGRVHVYVDVCHAGKIGTIENKGNRINAKFEDLARAEGDLFGFRASGSREPSYEGPQFGGGHGRNGWYARPTWRSIHPLASPGAGVVPS